MTERKTIFDRLKERNAQKDENRSNIFERVKRDNLNNRKAGSDIVTRQKRTVFDNIDENREEKNKSERGSVFDRIPEPPIDETQSPSENTSGNRKSFFDRVPDTPKKGSETSSSRESVFNRIPDGSRSSNNRLHESRINNIDNIKSETKSDKRKSVFREGNTPEISKAMEYAEKHFPEAYNEYSHRIRNMIKKLIPPTINVASNWGSVSIDRQRELVDKCTDLVRMYRATNIMDLINDIIDNSGYQKNVGFFETFKRNFYKQEEVDYNQEAEKSKQIINNIISDLDKLKAQAEDNIIPLWMISIASVDDTYTSDDEALNQTLHSRRMLLKNAYINVQTSKNELEKVRMEAVKMLSELDNVINVVLPAMRRKSYN